MSRVGKPKKYDENELLAILVDIANAYPEKKITYALLEHESSIPRYIWTSPAYPKVKDSIYELNKSHLSTRTSSEAKIIINNLNASIKKAKGSEKKINIISNDYTRAMNQILSVLEKSELGIKRLKEENSKLKKELEDAKRNESIYQKLYNEAYIKSALPEESGANNLDHSISSLNDGFLSPTDYSENEIKEKLKELLDK